MADHAIVARVTPDPSISNGTGFKWSYSVDGESFLDTPSSIHVPHGASSQIAVSIVAGGGAGDTCVFDPLKEPLEFTDENETLIPPPGWFQDLKTVGLSAITFTDNNTDNTQREDKTYHISINMVYTSKSSFNLKTSPDPTIVNEGTDHPRPIALSSPERMEPAAAAV